jgi:hypothetical protein
MTPDGELLLLELDALRLHMADNGLPRELLS